MRKVEAFKYDFWLKLRVLQICGQTIQFQLMNFDFPLEKLHCATDKGSRQKQLDLKQVQLLDYRQKGCSTN